MRITELEIQDFRGIRSLTLRPEGRNLVIWGPNGSGKSAVVDAIDFLLTGRIARLTGRGTAGISLTRHGPHIDSAPAAAVVRAIIEAPSLPGPVELRRCVADPNDLEYEASAGVELRPLLELARRGHQVLTRREILKYVATEAGTRAQEIQQLLNLTATETTRKALVTVHHQCQQAASQAKGSLLQAQSRVNAIIGASRFDERQVLNYVNQQRRVLGGDPLEAIDGELAAGLAVPVPADSGPNPHIDSARAALQALRSHLSDLELGAVRTAEETIAEVVSQFRTRPSLSEAMHRRRLLELGRDLIDESGACPLCEAPWEPDELRSRIRERLGEANEASAESSRLREQAEALRASLSSCAAAVESLLGTLPALDLIDLRQYLTAWRDGAMGAYESLDDPVRNYSLDEASRTAIASLYAPPVATEALSRVEAVLTSAALPASPAQEAWDRLTRLQEALVPVSVGEQRTEAAGRAHLRAKRLSDAYEQARNAVLTGLYHQVKDRFVALYRELHRSHEAGFTAELEPDGAGLEFRVDFYGRGVHPPQALHSEGHQDSMGICLYLALAERLSGGLIQMIVLDDVMMSVDADHRRELCGLLARAFPDRQLIITTHDRTWANQLRTEGVVTANRSVQFYGWEVTTGPRVLLEEDLWARIASDLDREDVPGAAHTLRRGSEEHFADVCDALWAPVRFRVSGRYELGDVLPAAVRRYMELLKRAKAAANSWSQKEVVDQLGELESVSAQVIGRTQVEQWAVNENVHYNAWADFRPADFRPVMEAFADLFDLFRCGGCATLLRVIDDGTAPSAVQCACGAVSWNLRARA